jgi:hypothetical protein
LQACELIETIARRRSPRRHHFRKFEPPSAMAVAGSSFNRRQRRWATRHVSSMVLASRLARQ